MYFTKISKNNYGCKSRAKIINDTKRQSKINIYQLPQKVILLMHVLKTDIYKLYFNAWLKKIKN